MENIIWGVTWFILGGIVGVIIDNIIVMKTLERKSKKSNRTPVMVNNEFYYIVPEPEYNMKKSDEV